MHAAVFFLLALNLVGTQVRSAPFPSDDNQNLEPYNPQLGLYESDHYPEPYIPQLWLELNEGDQNLKPYNPQFPEEDQHLEPYNHQFYEEDQHLEPYNPQFPEEDLHLEPNNPQFPEEDQHLEPYNPQFPEEDRQHPESFNSQFYEEPENLVSNAGGSPIPGSAESRSNHKEELIINGRNAGLGTFPWMVSVQRIGRNGLRYHWCGGSLWKRNKVITAAHCVNTNTSYFVGLGYRRLSLGNKNSQLIKVADVVRHPNYNKTSWQSNDIAVLTLKQDADINSYVSTIEMAAQRPPFYTNKNVTVAGWGLTSPTTYTDILQYTTGRIISRQACESYFNPGLITENHICLVGRNSNSCSGDSGGPVVYYKEDGKMEQVGIVSFGKKRCPGLAPTVHQSPQMHMDWLRRNLDC